MYGPAARCKRVCRRWLMRSCVNVFGLRLEHVLRAIMDISAHAILLADRPRWPFGSPVFASAGEDRSSIVFSFSRRTRRVEGIDHIIDSLLALPLFLCSCLAAVSSSRPAGSEVRRAQGPSRLAVALALPLATAWPGHALTVPSTARELSGLGRGFIGLDALEGAPVVKNRPGDAGELVGERDRQHVVV